MRIMVYIGVPDFGKPPCTASKEHIMVLSEITFYLLQDGCGVAGYDLGCPDPDAEAW